MNIWDSVHRSLDKASKEAARIAKGQRLRSQIEKASRQIHTQEDALLRQVMDLFLSGRLTQGELLPLCHELMSLQQQLSQAQGELQQLQSQGPQDMSAPVPPGTVTAEIVPPGPGYTPPPLTAAYPPIDATIPAVPPPPPPTDLQTIHSQETLLHALPASPASSESLTTSGQETMLMHEEVQAQVASGAGKGQSKGEGEGKANQLRCSQCGAEAMPGYYFCQRCGAALASPGNDYQPTVRASGSMISYTPGQETILPSHGRQESAPPSPDQAEGSSSSVPPPPPDTFTIEKDGGH